MRARDDVTVGIDLSGSNVRAAVVDAAGRVLGQERHRTLSKEPPQVAEAVIRAAKTACGAAGLPRPVFKGAAAGRGGLHPRGEARLWSRGTAVRRSACARRRCGGPRGEAGGPRRVRAEPRLEGRSAAEAPAGARAQAADDVRV